MPDAGQGLFLSRFAALSITPHGSYGYSTRAVSFSQGGINSTLQHQQFSLWKFNHEEHEVHEGKTTSRLRVLRSFLYSIVTSLAKMRIAAAALPNVTTDTASNYKLY